MPNVILEAMARGLMVIASDVGATSLLVQKENGSLIEPGDPQQIAQAMIDVLNQSEEAVQKSKAASLSKVNENFLWTKIGQQFVDQLQSYLGLDV